ncbi:MAG: putative porin [Bacteroidota bacterium]
MKYLIVLLTLFSVQILFAQESIFQLKMDTLKISHRIGGSKLDSVSDYNAGIISLNPGGYKYNAFGSFQTNYTSFLNSCSNQFETKTNSSFKYSSLPHLGFQYSFGSKGIQILRAEYEQFFSKKFGLNLVIDRNSIGEMMRDGIYKNNKFEFSTYFKGKFYKNLTSFRFNNSTINQNGGLDSSSNSVKLFPLNFLVVNKTDAKSELKNLTSCSHHYFNFLNDSLKDLGLVIKNDFKINNRVYEEQDSLQLIYKNIYLDSFVTRDQFQFAKIQSSTGLYLANKKLSSEILFSHAYWDFQNLSRHLDTTELSLSYLLGIDLGKVKLNSNSYYNLVGAKGEWYSKVNLLTEIGEIKVNGNLAFENILPTIFQRKYFSNTNLWYLKDIKTQQKVTSHVDFSYVFKEKQTLKFGLNHTSLKNNYFFVDTTWRNDTLTNLNILSLDLKADFRFKSLIFQPYVIVNQFSNELNFIPKIDFRTRIGFNRRLFKAKKMDFIAAVDFSYQSSRKLMSYASDLDLYVLSNKQFSNSSLYKIDFFTGFQIEQFRFYIKAENVNYIWDKSDSFVFENIPITPFLIRIGLTWDFFN